MKIFIGADHGGFALKEHLKGLLARQGYEIVDVGNSVFNEEDDYVDFGKEVAIRVMSESESKGILLCRNGMGMSIVANRFKGIRCGLAFNAETARRGRNDDDINVISLPADYISKEEAGEIVDVFLSEEFGGEGRYTRRLNKLELI